MITKPNDGNGPLLDGAILNERVVVSFDLLIGKYLILIPFSILLFGFGLFITLLVILNIDETVQFQEEKERDFFEML